MSREAWTDERLDDLTHRMDVGFHELREDMREFRREVRTDFERAESRIEALDAKFDRKFDGLNARFDSLQRLMIATLVTVVLAEVMSRF